MNENVNDVFISLSNFLVISIYVRFCQIKVFCSCLIHLPFFVRVFTFCQYRTRGSVWSRRQVFGSICLRAEEVRV